MPGTNLKIFCTTGWKSLAVFIKSWREAGECQSVMDFFCKYHFSANRIWRGDRIHIHTVRVFVPFTCVMKERDVQEFAPMIDTSALAFFISVSLWFYDRAC
jgi:hypothetical protein